MNPYFHAFEASFSLTMLLVVLVVIAATIVAGYNGVYEVNRLNARRNRHYKRFAKRFNKTDAAEGEAVWDINAAEEHLFSFMEKRKLIVELDNLRRIPAKIQYRSQTYFNATSFGLALLLAATGFIEHGDGLLQSCMNSLGKYESPAAGLLSCAMITGLATLFCMCGISSVMAYVANRHAERIFVCYAVRGYRIYVREKVSVGFFVSHGISNIWRAIKKRFTQPKITETDDEMFARLVAEQRQSQIETVRSLNEVFPDYDDRRIQ